MKVEEVAIVKIVVVERYRNDMGNVEELAQSMTEKGMLQPITLDQDYRLLAGGRRLAAAQLNKWETIPAIIQEVQGDIDRLEIELFENIHRKDMAWHERASLEKKISDLKTAENPNWTQRDQAQLLDVSIGSVNRRLQLADYLVAVPELKSIATEEQAWKAVKKVEEGYMIDALKRKREVINNGEPDKDLGYAKYAKNHYKVGDTLEGMRKMNEGVMHFAEIDPPYAIQLDRRKSRSQDTKMENYNEVPAAGYVQFVRAVAEQVFRILDRNAFAIWWFGSEWYQPVLAELREAGFKVNDIAAIWYKGQQGQTASPDTMLGSSYEQFFVLRKGDPKLAKPGRSNVFHFSPLAPSRKIHATEKPMDLMLEILETFLYPGSRVLVPFAGSGVTLRAAYRTNHVALGWDLSAEHKKKFLMRVDEDHLLGIKPKLIKAAGEE